MKKIITLLMLFGFMSTFAQNQLKHEKKYYQDEKGSLYMNKHLPVYIWLSNEKGEACKKIRLKSASSPQYSDPFYWDTEGINTVRTPSKVDTVTKIPVYPAEDIVFEVYSDGLAPKSNCKFKGAKSHLKDKLMYYGPGLNVELLAKDEVSGLENVYSSINQDIYKKYSTEIKFADEKKYTLSFYSVDNVGNVESPNQKVFQVDLTNPKVSYEFEGTKHKNVVSKDTKLIIKAEDQLSGVSGVYYQLEGKNEVRYNAPIPVMFFGNGPHKMIYYAVDNVGNSSKDDGGSNINIEEFIVDNKAPIVKHEMIGDEYVGEYRYVSARTKCKLSAEDDNTEIESIEYGVGTDNLSKYSAPFIINEKNGWANIKFRASDMVKNSSAVKKVSVYVDAKAPVTGIKYHYPKFFAKDTLYINSKTSVKLFANDVGSGVKMTEYRINNGEWIAGDKFNVGEDGYKNIEFRSRDNVNNVEEFKSSKVFVDNKPPVIYNRFSIEPIRVEKHEGKDIEVYPNYVNLYLSATDGSCGTKKIEYQIDNGTLRNYIDANNPGDVALFKKNKVYEVKIIAHDMLMNKSEKIIMFKISDK